MAAWAVGLATVAVLGSVALGASPVSAARALQPTTTTVASSLNPSVFGQSVTFTATVESTAVLPVGTTATSVYGQPDLTSGASNNGGLSSASLNHPHDTVFDAAGGLYVPDSNNHRVLYYPKGSTLATRVYGQNGNFTSATANLGGVSATSLDYPFSVALDKSGNLYVADADNNRVLFYPAGTGCSAPNTPAGCGTATKVWGQNGNFTTNSNGTTAATLNFPHNLLVDGSGNLYVSDHSNDRVLVFPPNSGCTAVATPLLCGIATGVYGQNGDFTTGTSSASATGLSVTNGLAMDGTGGLYVADRGNNRILYFPSGSACSAVGLPVGCGTATKVYGQAGDFTTSTSGTSQTTLDGPAGIGLDAGGALYVSEQYNDRVLYFAPNTGCTAPSTPAGCGAASAVYGQPDFTTSNSGTTATSMNYPASASVDAKGNLYVAEGANNRILVFPATVPTGTVTFFDGTTSLGTGTLVGDPTATLTTSTLAVGTHPITAVYGGGGIFAGSTSAVLNQVVTVPVPPTGAGTAVSSPAVAGGALVLIVLGSISTAVGVRRRRLQ